MTPLTLNTNKHSAATAVTLLYNSTLLLAPALSYHGYRFPPEIISHAVWLDHRVLITLFTVRPSGNGQLVDDNPKWRPPCSTWVG